ncbi:hypothetical protein RchiOBHm_Chr2g0116841 [Rosa chinensis]|uniref:Uncharacterized protein n=1 Tax=Rosa chinensis TaxID=74649 RepID=A0A2P6RRC4_ROSCH|nr:hypothetical protein RchiOBHm_Chr2g0116841 [Rosa chinensis]
MTASLTAALPPTPPSSTTSSSEISIPARVLSSTTKSHLQTHPLLTTQQEVSPLLQAIA